MKTLLISLFFFALTSFTVNTASNESLNNENNTVIICTGKYAKRYHNSICRGMKACKGEQKNISLTKAKDMGLTPCGYCYR